MMRGAYSYSLVSLLCGLGASVAAAQPPSGTALPRRAAASRVELDSLATQAQADASAAGVDATKRELLQRYAGELRARLNDGDFRPGDRMVLVTRGDSLRVDTLTVQADGSVLVGKLPPIALDGVLWSELQAHLAECLRQYVKADVVRAEPLVRVGLLGEVAHPGYYQVPLEITVGDALMVAGGPLPQADITRIAIRRGELTVVDARSLRDAMVRGLPLSRVGINAGDEIVVSPTRTRNWLLITQVGGLLTGIAFTLHTLKVF